MLAETYYDKALSNFKAAKLIFYRERDDEEQLNIVGYHLQQTIEFLVKYILNINGVSTTKTHDIDQLIVLARNNKVNLYLPTYILEHSDTFSNWESKTRYSLGFYLDVKKVEETIVSINEYLEVLSKKLHN